MATLRYAVLQVGDVWKIVCERRHIGHFASCEAASRAGAQLAREATYSGYDVELLVQGLFGEISGEQFEAHKPDEAAQAGDTASL
jgi:hypothetical protein